MEDKVQPQENQTTQLKHRNLHSTPRLDDANINLELWGSLLTLSRWLTTWETPFHPSLIGCTRRADIIPWLNSAADSIKFATALRPAIHAFSSILLKLSLVRLANTDIIFLHRPRSLILYLQRKERTRCKRIIGLDSFHASAEVCDRAGIPPVDTRNSFEGAT